MSPASARRAAHAAFSVSKSTRYSARSSSDAPRRFTSAASASPSVDAAGAAAYEPPLLPGRTSISPTASSDRSASRRVGRPTPNSSHSRRSPGNRSPGARRPEMIASRSWATMSSNDRTRRTLVKPSSVTDPA